MRIALIPHGARGDVQPLIALGAELMRQGHAPALYAPDRYQPLSQAVGVTHRSTGDDHMAPFRDYTDRVSTGKLAQLRNVERLLRESVQQQFQMLMEMVDDAEMVIGAGLMLAGPTLAEKLGVPYRFCAYSPTLLVSREHPPIMLPSSLPRWATGAAWWAGRALYNRLFRKDVNQFRAASGLAPVADVYSALMGKRTLLMVDREIAALPDDCRLDPIQTGYPALQVSETLPAEINRFLRDGDTPLYIGFGSMTDLDPVETTALIDEALELADARALVGRGWAGLGQGEHSERMHIVGPMDHANLFQHVSAVVHHGGAGTVATAARAGVPQIIAPHLMDQGYWAERVFSLKIGPPALSRRRLRASRLADAIRVVKEDPTYHRNAAALADTLSQRQPAADAVKALLEYD